MQPTSLKALFQNLCPDALMALQGRVTSENPVSVTAVNDPKLIISGGALLIPKELTDHKIKIVMEETPDKAQEPKEAAGQAGAEEKEILIKNALKKGDTVYLLPLNEGRRYVVLGRVK